MPTWSSNPGSTPPPEMQPRPAAAAPAEREALVHTRSLDIRVFRRNDGLWDVEGRMVDIKPVAYHMKDSSRAAGEPLHDMVLCLTIDADLTVTSAWAHMHRGAHDLCPAITPDYSKLAGLRIGPGWNRKVRERVGAIQGCTHLTEMLGQMATAAMQGMWQELAETGATSVPINTCHAYASDSAYVKEFFPEHFAPLNRKAGG
ncbi:DUF2889 domain-containing protein [Marinibaculum pumilum]|uniref:DUF2889 domain-containing protein n=1 Tax=Marinibaculum pumilum TaxID=1766165 RepID=A0ABV7KWV5_9PROT